MQILLQVVIST